MGLYYPIYGIYGGLSQSIMGKRPNMGLKAATLSQGARKTCIGVVDASPSQATFTCWRSLAIQRTWANCINLYISCWPGQRHELVVSVISTLSFLIIMFPAIMGYATIFIRTHIHGPPPLVWFCTVLAAWFMAERSLESHLSMTDQGYTYCSQSLTSQVLLGKTCFCWMPTFLDELPGWYPVVFACLVMLAQHLPCFRINHQCMLGGLWHCFTMLHEHYISYSFIFIISQDYTKYPNTVNYHRCAKKNKSFPRNMISPLTQDW